MGFFKNDRAKVTVISPQEARKIMTQSDSADNYVLLDVRTPLEYEQIRIAGARLIPVDELERRAPAELPDKNIPILVYCKSGMRALKAAETLVNMGYANVRSFGGILNWPYETEPK